MTQPDARYIKKRLLPSSDWIDAPKHVRELALAGESRGIAYDVTHGWCVIETGGEPKLLYVEKKK